MDVRQQLASLGDDLGQFNQGDFSNNFLQIEGVDVTKGYCAGVCLDWTRRVLLSGADRDKRFLNYSSPKNANVSVASGETRQTQTLRRMATAYRGQGASYVTTTRKSELIPRLTALLSEPESQWTLNGQDVTGVAVSNEMAQRITKLMAVTPNPFNMQQEPAAVVPRARIQGWLTHLGNMADAQHSRLADGGREWGQYAKELDDRFSQSKKKKFGRLQVVRSSNQETYGEPGVWLYKLLNEGLMDNCCTIAGVGAPGDSGHAVAVHQLGSGYRFFDPNYGVYNFSKESLGNALQHLFWTPLFKNDTGLDPDLPVYRRRDKETDPRTGKEVARDNKPWTRMSYTIFAAANG